MDGWRPTAVGVGQFRSSQCASPVRALACTGDCACEAAASPRPNDSPARGLVVTTAGCLSSTTKKFHDPAGHARTKVNHTRRRHTLHGPSALATRHPVIVRNTRTSSILYNASHSYTQLAVIKGDWRATSIRRWWPLTTLLLPPPPPTTTATQTTTQRVSSFTTSHSPSHSTASSPTDIISHAERLYEHYYGYFRHCELTAASIGTHFYTFGLPWAIAHAVLSAKCTYPGALGAFFATTRAAMILSVDFPLAASRLDDATSAHILDEAVRLATSSDGQVTPTKRPSNSPDNQAELKKPRPSPPPRGSG